MSYQLIRGDALTIPLANDSVDAVVTSPPYFSLRSYTDGGEHYEGQIGSEPTPREFLEALWAVTAECVRVLKPSGSLWVNLGDKYAGSGGGNQSGVLAHRNPAIDAVHDQRQNVNGVGSPRRYNQNSDGIPAKSLMGLPWRYAIGCIDQLGLILRAEVIWSKPNGLPESVTDRVRRSHEQWFMFTKSGGEVVEPGAQALPLCSLCGCPADTRATLVARLHEAESGVEDFDLPDEVGSDERVQGNDGVGAEEPGVVGLGGTAVPLAIPVDGDGVEDAADLLNDSGCAVVDQDAEMGAAAAAVAEGDGPLTVDDSGQPGEVCRCSHPFIIDDEPWIPQELAAELMQMVADGEADAQAVADYLSGNYARSHSTWFHFTKEPRYFSAVDEVREAQVGGGHVQNAKGTAVASDGTRHRAFGKTPEDYNPLGKLPGSVWTIATEPLRVPDHIGVDHFACVDAETEILSDGGWITHDQLRPGAMVAGYNLDTSTAEWTRCHAVHRYDHDGPLVAVEKRDLSMRVTPNHRCIIQRGAGRRDVVRADELLPAHRIPRSANWAPYERKSIGEPLAALLGWVAAEGWVTKAGAVYLSQSLTENGEHVGAIDALLARVDIPPILKPRTKHRITMNTLHRKQRTRTYRGLEWEDVTWRLPLGLAQQVTSLLDDKHLTWSMLWLPENERRALLDAFIDGDGHRRPDGRIGIFQKHRRNLDVLQAIAVTLGYRTSLTEQADRFVLYLTSGQRWITLRGTAGEATPIPTEHYRGTVWCPTTGTGTFIARRRGRVFITGNSFPSEWPRRIILGWSPSGVCVACGEGRRPVVAKSASGSTEVVSAVGQLNGKRNDEAKHAGRIGEAQATITGYACACPDTTAPTRPAVVLDPFVGTGTTVAVAHALGRHGIGIDLSADYLRLAEWRCNNLALAEKVADRSGMATPKGEHDGMEVQPLFGGAS